MALVSFTPFERLTASELNLAFSDSLSLSTTGTQQVASNVNLPSLNASISLQTEQLIVTGDALFASDSAITMPVGTTFERPPVPSFGMIRANSDAGTIEVMLASGNWASIVTTTAATTPQSPPVNMGGVQFGQATSSAIPLGWTNPSGGTAPFQFTVQYRLAGTTNWTIWIAATTAFTTTIGGLLPATRYEFQITAFNGAGSAISPVTATNTIGFLSGGPSNVTASSPTSTTMGLTWLAVSSVTPISYQVEYAGQGATSWTVWNGPVMDTAVTVTGLIPNTTFNFQVIAKTLNASFTSLAAIGVTTSAATVSPNSVTGLTFPSSSITNNGFTVSWSPPTAGTVPICYFVQYQLAGTSAWIQYKYGTTATSLAVTGLDSGSGYNVRIQAVNSAGASLSSGTDAVTTLAAVTVSNTVAGNDVSGSTYPIISGPAVVSVIAGGAIPVAGVTVLDPPATFASGTLAITVTCSLGNVTMTDTNNNQITGSGTKKIVYSGTLGSIQIAAASLVYTAASTAGSDNISISITDQLIQQSNLTIATSVTATAGSPSPPRPPNSPPSSSVTATGQPTDPTGSLANRVGNFTNGMGIVTRFGDFAYDLNFTLAQAATLENMVNYVSQGQMSYLRDAITPSFNSTFYTQIASNTDMRYILSIDAVAQASITINSAPDWGTFALPNMEILAGIPGMTAGFQGVINSDLVTPSQLASAGQFQATLYAAAHSFGLHAWQMTAQPTDMGTFGTPPADIATAVCYPPYSPNGPALSGTGITAGTQGYLGATIAQAKTVTPNLPVGITECGWKSFPVGTSNTNLLYVDENVQASYLLEFLLSAYKLGASYFFVNELLDAPILSSVEDVGQTYGLFNTAGTQKISAYALQVMMTVLTDNSPSFVSFTPGFLNYTVTNKPATYSGFINTGYQDIVFQKSAGDYWICMWNEQALNTVGGNNATIGVPPVNVTLTFNSGAKSTVNVYDPLFIQTSLGPVQRAVSVSSITIPLPAHPIFVQVIF